LDVQASSDDVPIVFHDYTLERLTGEAGSVQARTAKELEKTAITGSKDRVPTLETVMAQVDGKVPLLVEVKDQDRSLGSNIGRLSENIARLVEQYAGPVAVMSFNPHHVADMPCARGLVTCVFNRTHWAPAGSDRLAAVTEMLDLDAVGASFISHDRRRLDHPAVARAKASGRTVLCWTVRSRKEDKAAREVADNVTFEGYDPL